MLISPARFSRGCCQGGTGELNPQVSGEPRSSLGVHLKLPRNHSQVATKAYQVLQLCRAQHQQGALARS